MSLEDRAMLAAQLAGHVSMWFAAAAVAEDRAQKIEFLTKGFRSWALTARNMTLLERVAKNCAKAGYDDAAMVAEIVEGRAE